MRTETAVLLALAIFLGGCLVSYSSETKKSGAAPTAKQVAVKDERIAELEAQVRELQEKYDRVLVRLEGPRTVPGGWTDVPPIDAKVSGVNVENNIVALSAGKDDGVKPGFEFTIYRGDEYVGRVIVDDVQEEHCTGYSKRELEAKPIEVGDEARTRW